MGRKRHLLVDTQGHTQGFARKVVVSAAEVQDRDAARLVAQALQVYGPELPRLTKVWADAGYSGPLGDELRTRMGWEVEIVQRSDTQPKDPFAALSHRWMVERTFAWWGGLRRLSRDYEYQVESSEALIYAGMTHLMLRRMTREHAARSSPPA